MVPSHKQVLATLEAGVERRMGEAPQGALRVIVSPGFGHGDQARALAFCKALRCAHPNAYILFLMQWTDGAAMVEWDMAHCAISKGVVNSCYWVQRAPYQVVLGSVRERCDVLFDCNAYPVAAYWNQRTGGIEALRRQIEADQRLKPFNILYDGHPRVCGLLAKIRLSQWDIMARSSGYGVEPHMLDCAAPVECAEWPDLGAGDLDMVPVADGEPADAALTALKTLAGNANWSRAKLSNVGQYVVVHNSAGYASNNKVAPPEVFDAIVSKLGERGIRAVQVGEKSDPEIKWAIDRRGQRIAITNKLMRGAIGLIDVEGFLPYMAFGLGVPAMVLFGPTMRDTFGFDGNMNVVRNVIKTDRDGNVRSHHVPCPIGTCFWSGDMWSARCHLDKEANPSYPRCMNFVSADDAAATALTFAETYGGDAFRARQTAEEAVA